MRGINGVRKQISLIWWNWTARESCFLVQVRIWAVRSFSGYYLRLLGKRFNLIFPHAQWMGRGDLVLQWGHNVPFKCANNCP